MVVEYQKLKYIATTLDLDGNNSTNHRSFLWVYSHERFQAQAVNTL